MLFLLQVLFCWMMLNKKILFFQLGTAISSALIIRNTMSYLWRHDERSNDHPLGKTILDNEWFLLFAKPSSYMNEQWQTSDPMSQQSQYVSWTFMNLKWNFLMKKWIVNRQKKISSWLFNVLILKSNFESVNWWIFIKIEVNI